MFNEYAYDQQNLRHAKLPPRMPVVSSLGIMDGTKIEKNLMELKKRVDSY
ncbi:hypothetical protein Q5M85_07650 [Paraclostridium bifermentans]|nr:hypothetical protein [Paraclostridium bifermentans]